MTAFAARSAELVNMDWNQLKRCTESGPSGKGFYKLNYDRSKQRGGIKSRTDNCCFIRGKLEVLAIDNYVACFKSGDEKKGIVT